MMTLKEEEIIVIRILVKCVLHILIMMMPLIVREKESQKKVEKELKKKMMNVKMILKMEFK